jgi:predicted nucleotide-binding protein
MHTIAEVLSCMPYHVRITQRSHPSFDEVKLDLTWEDLETRFLRPYREGRPITIGGKTIDISDIERLRINLTDQDSASLLSMVQAKRRRDGAVFGLSDEWEIADMGDEKTDELITGPPGSYLSSEPIQSIEGPAPNGGPDPRSVFVIHGRNETARSNLFIFLRSLGLSPIEWNEAIKATGRANPYIGNVLDAAFEKAQTLLVLFTPDDVANLRPEFHASGDPEHETKPTPQARPNVLFEAGMAIGRFEDRTVLVELGRCRPFSDVGGKYILRLDNSTERRQELAEGLRAAGAAAITTGTEWHSAGDLTPPF